MNHANGVRYIGAVIGWMARTVGALGLGCVLTAQAQMSTPGQLAVSEAGAASYSIPIQIPPGVTGMQPSLALVYSSQGGNGLLGVGWSLSGLSSISRCARTLAQDNVRGTVNYNLDDRYCLDGQRLMAISGADGADLTEYRTERESFSKIVSYAEAGATGGPGSFVVKTSAGLTMEYGKTAASRIEAKDKSVVAVWALNKVYDTKGNSYTVTYTEDSDNGQFYPSRIDYAGSTNSLFLEYENRPEADIAPTYFMDSLTKVTKRLSKVRITVAGTETHQYRLSYQTAPGTKRSLLASVLKCATTCQPQQAFAYDDSRISVATTTYTGVNPGNEGWDVGDIFGDGKEVYWTHNSNGQHFAIRINLDGTAQNWSWSGGHGVGNGGWRLVDLFGDGRKVYWSRTDGTHYATRLNADGTLQNWTWSGGHGLGNRGYDFVDLFGDGRQVYWTLDTSGKHYATRLNPDGTVNNWTWLRPVVPMDIVENGDFKWVDLFGDGRLVYWERGPFSNHVAIRLNENGTSNRWSWNGVQGVGDKGWSFGDIFGDGRATYWTHSANGTHMATRLNSDGTLKNWTWTGGSGVGDGGWRLVNIFGDGRKVYWTRNGTTHFATRLNPDGTLQNWTWSGWSFGENGNVLGAPPEKTQWDFVDLFGDGRDVYWATGAQYTAGYNYVQNHYMSKMYPDGSVQNISWNAPVASGACIWCIALDTWKFADFDGSGRKSYWQKSSAVNYLSRPTIGDADVLTGIDGGLGRNHTVTYGKLPALMRPVDPRYVRDVASSYPKAAIVPPMPVVTDVSSPNGVGGLSTTNYSYGNLLADLSPAGRGLLGFQWVQNKDASSGVVSRTYYRQDWPYLGLVDRSGKGTNSTNWSNLGLTVNTAFTCNAIAGMAAGVPCTTTGTTPTVKPGSRYFIYPNQIDAQAWDYTGTTATNGVFIALPRTRTTQTLDDYGNATMVKLETLNPDGSPSGYSKTTNSVFAPADTTKWYLGRLVRSSVTATAP